VKNVDVYEQLFNAELKNEYVIKPNGFFTHLGVDVTKYVNGSPIMYYKGEKIGLKKYLKFR
jgi:hypothetical protein